MAAGQLHHVMRYVLVVLHSTGANAPHSGSGKLCLSSADLLLRVTAATVSACSGPGAVAKWCVNVRKALVVAARLSSSVVSTTD